MSTGWRSQRCRDVTSCPAWTLYGQSRRDLCLGVCVNSQCGTHIYMAIEAGEELDRSWRAKSEAAQEALRLLSRPGQYHRPAGPRTQPEPKRACAGFSRRPPRRARGSGALALRTEPAGQLPAGAGAGGTDCCPLSSLPPRRRTAASSFPLAPFQPPAARPSSRGLRALHGERSGGGSQPGAGACAGLRGWRGPGRQVWDPRAGLGLAGRCGAGAGLGPGQV